MGFRSRRPPFETFSPARADSRAGEARAFCDTARHLNNLTANGLRCQFNLRMETAERILIEARERRDRA